ncbi:hypothetical protein Tco_0705146 [Tanacetum coccineum]|uniref:Uncharacterized protein n=1 Tax=Tanacetum coccineum TaxID=301880 RepID=A0ABQ4Y4M7_9ASTR
MNLPRSGYQELGYANNTNEVRKLLGLTGYYRSTKGGYGFPVSRLKVGMEKTSSPKTKGGNERLSIPIVRVEIMLQAYLEVARRNGRPRELNRVNTKGLSSGNFDDDICHYPGKANTVIGAVVSDAVISEAFLRSYPVPF